MKEKSVMRDDNLMDCTFIELTINESHEEGARVAQCVENRVPKRNSMAIDNILNHSKEDLRSETQWSITNGTRSSEPVQMMTPTSMEGSLTPAMGACDSRSLSPTTSLTDVDPIISTESSPGSGTPMSRGSTPTLSQTYGTPILANRNPITSLGRQGLARRRSDRGPNDNRHRISSDKITKKNIYRRPYTYEQEMFLWFFMTEVPLDRQEELLNKYKAKWPEEKDRSKGGLQCKLYRIIRDFKVPSRRNQTGTGGRKDAHKYGMWAVMGHRYPWMDQYADRLPGYEPGGPYHMDEHP